MISLLCKICNRLALCCTFLHPALQYAGVEYLLPCNDPMKPIWDRAVLEHRLELGFCEPCERILLALCRLTPLHHPEKINISFSSAVMGLQIFFCTAHWLHTNYVCTWSLFCVHISKHELIKPPFSISTVPLSGRAFSCNVLEHSSSIRLSAKGKTFKLSNLVFFSICKIF